MNEDQEKQWLVDRINVTLDGLIDQHNSLKERICIPIDGHLSSLHEKRKIVIGTVVFIATLFLGLDNLSSKPEWLQSIPSNLFISILISDILVGVIIYFLIGYLINRTSEYKHYIVESYVAIKERMNFLKGFIITGSKDLGELDIPLLHKFLNFSSLNSASKFVFSLKEHEKFHSSKFCPDNVSQKTREILNDNISFVNLSQKQFQKIKSVFQKDDIMTLFLPALKPLENFDPSEFPNTIKQSS